MLFDDIGETRGDKPAGATKTGAIIEVIATAGDAWPLPEGEDKRGGDRSREACRGGVAKGDWRCPPSSAVSSLPPETTPDLLPPWSRSTADLAAVVRAASSPCLAASWATSRAEAAALSKVERRASRRSHWLCSARASRRASRASRRLAAAL